MGYPGGANQASKGPNVGHGGNSRVSGLAPQMAKIEHPTGPLLSGIITWRQSAYFGGLTVAKFGPIQLKVGPVSGPSRGCDGPDFFCKKI